MSAAVCFGSKDTHEMPKVTPKPRSNQFCLKMITEAYNGSLATTCDLRGICTRLESKAVLDKYVRECLHHKYDRN